MTTPSFGLSQLALAVSVPSLPMVPGEYTDVSATKVKGSRRSRRFRPVSILFSWKLTDPPVVSKVSNWKNNVYLFSVSDLYVAS